MFGEQMPSNKITFGCGHLLFTDTGVKEHNITEGGDKQSSSNLNARNSRQSSISSYKSPVK